MTSILYIIIGIYNNDDRLCISEAGISVATHVGADGHVLYSGVHRVFFQDQVVFKSY